MLKSILNDLPYFIILIIIGFDIHNHKITEGEFIIGLLLCMIMRTIKEINDKI